MKSILKLLLLPFCISFCTQSYCCEKCLDCFTCSANPENTIFPKPKSYFIDDWAEPGFQAARQHEEIFFAIKDGNLEKTKEIFEEKDFKIEETAPFIHAAAMCGHENIVKYFLRKGASVNELCLAEKKINPRETTYQDMKEEKKLVSLNLVATNAPDDSDMIEFLVKRGAKLEGIGSNHTLISRVSLKNKPQARAFLLKQGGAFKTFPKLRQEYQGTRRRLSSLREKNKKALKLYDQTPELLKSDAFAFNKFSTLEKLVRDRKEIEENQNVNWADLFTKILFCQEFFRRKNIARFANTKFLRDSSGQTVLDLMLASKDLLMQNPKFIPTVLQEVGYRHRDNFDEFCEKIYTDEQSVSSLRQTVFAEASPVMSSAGQAAKYSPDKQNPNREEAGLAHLLKTKAMAQRMYNQAEKYMTDATEDEKEKLIKLKKTAEKFLRDLKNTTFIADLLVDPRIGLPVECVLHCISFTDGNFGTKKIQEPLTPNQRVNALIQEVGQKLKQTTSEHCIIS